MRIHRLTQATFLDHSDDSILRETFDAASVLLCEAFPTQQAGETLLSRWNICQTYIQHAQSLARHYVNYRRRGKQLSPVKQFAELLSNCAFYLHEIGDNDDTLELLAAAITACTSEDELLRAHLLNTEGLVHHQAMEFAKSERAFRLCNEINLRYRHLEETAHRIPGIKNNIANLRATQGDYGGALDLYLEAESESVKDESTYSPETECRFGLNISRVLIAKDEVEQAKQLLDKVKCTMDISFENMLYRAAWHYIYGAVELHSDNPAKARKHYVEAQKLQQVVGPYQVAHCATLYKLAIVDMKLGDLSKAR